MTGAARGIGAAAARRFAAEGARVVVADVLDDDGAAVAAELGEQALYIHLDVRHQAAWDQRGPGRPGSLREPRPPSWCTTPA